MTTTRYRFDRSTQFTWEDDAISLRQGLDYIAKGYLVDWLTLFQNCEKLINQQDDVAICKTLFVRWEQQHNAIAIQDSVDAKRLLIVAPKEMKQLEEILLELHQGCCNPVSFNLVADIIQEPDEILKLLQDITSFKLTEQQIKAAKESLSLLPTEYEIEVLDLYNIWSATTELSYFAKALQFYFLAD